MQSQAENKYSSCVFNQGLKLEKVEYNFKQGYQESKKATTFFFFLPGWLLKQPCWNLMARK